MLVNFFVVFISAVALLMVCWMLTEYWLRSVRKLSVEKISSLGILDRMAFAFEDFCGSVNHKKDFRKMRVKDEMGSVRMVGQKKLHKLAEANQEEISKENGYVKKEKKYKIKVNM